MQTPIPNLFAVTRDPRWLLIAGQHQHQHLIMGGARLDFHRQRRDLQTDICPSPWWITRERQHEPHFQPVCRWNGASRTVPAGEAHTKNLLLLRRWNYYWTGIKISWRQHWRNWRVWGVVVLSFFFFALNKIVLSVALKSRRCHSPRNYSLRYPFGAKFVDAYFFLTFKFPSFKMKFWSGFSEICFAAANRQKSHDAIHKLQHM